eukprot:Skav202591  [mRNA]  locus=scaffold1305:154263:154660:+ [translate_table: standard]
MPGGQGAKQSSAAVHQIWASFVVISRDHKELLLPTKIAVHRLGIGANSNGLQHAQTAEFHCIHGSQQRRFFIDAFAEVRYKSARNVEALVHHEGRR